MFELGAFIASYGLRFINSTVLRSILVPAAFGIMDFVTGVGVGMIMLTDVGIRQAIIRSPRGDEQVFLDTAWTMQVVRGIALWVLSIALAYPAVWITDEPILLYLLPVASLTTLLQGLTSTAESTLRRQMSLGRITAIDLGTQLAALATTITWALIDASVWALVAGGIVSGVLHMIASHYLAFTLGYRNRVRWDREVRREIFEFGKWITGSSALFFAGMWSDRLMLVAFVGATTAGVYATALLISETVVGAAQRVLGGVFYSLFAQVSHDGVDRLRSVYYRTRLRVDALSMGATGVLLAVGPWLIRVLFDERYTDAGWMLRLLALRAATLCVVSPGDVCLTSLGLSRYGFYQNLARAIWVLGGVPIGYSVGGTEGVVWVAALSGFPSLLLLLRAFHIEKLLRIDRELLAWIFFGAGIMLGFGVLALLPDALELRAFVRTLLFD